MGYVVSWNGGAERFKGYKAKEIIGRHFSVFMTPEDKARGIPAMALRTAAEQGEFEAEGWRVRKDGSRFWAHAVVDPIRGENGELLGFAKITRDITEKKKAQEALRESEERFRLLVQGATDYAIFMLTPEGIVSNWNPGAQRLKGYTENEIVGSHFSRFYTPEDIERGLPARALNTAAETGRFENEGWRMRKDGSRFMAHVVIDAIRNEMGELVGFMSGFRSRTQASVCQPKRPPASLNLFSPPRKSARAPAWD
jgi:PAS domain S-box-containing protein